jgi:hypothetical protein
VALSLPIKGIPYAIHLRRFFRFAAGRRQHLAPSRSSYSASWVMQFDDQAPLDRYGKHPVHQKAAEEAFLPLS